MDSPADVTELIGCCITRNRIQRTMHIDQSSSIRALQTKLEYLQCKPAQTPMDSSFKATKADCPTSTTPELTVKQTHYRSALMSLVYFSRLTMPQITYAVSKLGKFLSNLGEVHMGALKRLLRYVFWNAHIGINFPSQKSDKTKLYGYSDTSFADDIDTKRSTMGHVFFYAGCPMSWSSKLHS